MIKVNFTPKTDIEEYLNNDFNLEIFEELTENEDWQGTFEPLEFLNLLYEQFEIVNANKEKPLSVVKHLFGLKLERTKLYYLLNYLNKHIYKHSGSEDEPKDKQLSICRCRIEKEYDKLEAELYPDEEPETENKYDFQKVKQHIETFETVKEKILYLTEIKTDFLQNKPYWDFSFETPFDRKCELEIKKLNEVLKLEAHTTTPIVKALPPQPIKTKADILKAPVLPPPPKEKTLSELITDQNSVEIVEGIKIQYKNIKGKRLKLLLLALQELNLLPKERIAQKFYNCCKAEFGWNVASYTAMNDYQFNDRTDQFELNEMKQYLETKMKAK